MDRKSRSKTTYLVIFILSALIIGFSIGAAYGTYQGFKIAVNIGLNYLETQNLSIGVDRAAFINDLWTYKNRIGEFG